MAVGDDWSARNPQTSLTYTLNNGTWQLQPAIPLPSDYLNNLVASSVSCPDDNDCVVVGSYGNQDANTTNPETSHGFIDSDTAGTWSTEEALLPSNGNPNPGFIGLQVLDSVDCADAADCVAGGSYEDTSGNRGPLLETLQTGSWTPSEAPVPSDSQSNTLAAITGISCPAVGACVADGYYWVDFNAQIESGMLLTQSSTGWSAAAAPTPNSVFGAVRMSASTQKTKSTKAKASLNGISCLKKGVCRGVGQYGKRGLIERKRSR